MPFTVSKPRVVRITPQYDDGAVSGATATASYDVSLGEPEEIGVEAQITIDLWGLLTTTQKRQLQAMVTKVINALPEA